MTIFQNVKSAKRARRVTMVAYVHANEALGLRVEPVTKKTGRGPEENVVKHVSDK